MLLSCLAFFTSLFHSNLFKLCVTLRSMFNLRVVSSWLSLVLFWNFRLEWFLLLGYRLCWLTLFQLLQFLLPSLFRLNLACSLSNKSAISQYMLRTPWVSTHLAADLSQNWTHLSSDICFFRYAHLLILLALFFLNRDKDFLKKHPLLHVFWSLSFIVYRVRIWYVASNWNNAWPRDVFHVTFMVDALIFEGFHCAGNGRCLWKDGNAILTAVFYSIIQVFALITWTVRLPWLITTFLRLSARWTFPSFFNWTVNCFNLSGFKFVLIFFISICYWCLLCLLIRILPKTIQVNFRVVKTWKHAFLRHPTHTRLHTS